MNSAWKISTDISTIYRILYDLEERGMVTSDEDAAASVGRRAGVCPHRRRDELLRSWIGELQQPDRCSIAFSMPMPGTKRSIVLTARRSGTLPGPGQRSAAASPIADNDSMEED